MSAAVAVRQVRCFFHSLFVMLAEALLPLLDDLLAWAIAGSTTLHPLLGASQVITAVGYVRGRG